MNVGLWWCKAILKLLDYYMHHEQVMLQLLWYFLCSFTQIIPETQIISKITWGLHSTTLDLSIRFSSQSIHNYSAILHRNRPTTINSDKSSQPLFPMDKSSQPLFPMEVFISLSIQAVNHKPFVIYHHCSCIHITSNSAKELPTSISIT